MMIRRRQLISILALLVVLQIAGIVVVVPLTLAFTTTSLQSHSSLSTHHDDALTTNYRKKQLLNGISYNQNSIHNIKQLSYSNTNVQLNLVPISEAWDCNISHDKQQSACSFASLLPTLGCNSFNSQGMLIHTSFTSTDNKQDDIPNNKRYRLYLATNIDDLPSITKLTLEVFDATAITLSSTNWTAFEQVIVGIVVSPVLDMYNSYAQAVGYTEVLSGLRRRMRNRLVTTNDQISMNGEDDVIGYTGRYDWLAPLITVDNSDNDDASTTTTSDSSSSSLEEIAARSSLILTLARPSSENDDDDNDMETVASVELRLQPTDAKIPFSQPWLDVVERRLVNLLPFVKEDTDELSMSSDITPNDQSTDTTNSKNNNQSHPPLRPCKNNNQTHPPLRPYLCNLCVSSSLRSLGIGRALCRIVEAIARDKWGYSHIYLHVDPTNDAARTLYETEGYVDVGKRWNVLWAGGANEISYYVKKL